MNSKAVDYRHFKGFTALFAALFLVLMSSCASRQYSFLVCDQLRGENGFGFITFDSTYVSSNNLRNKWILDSVRNAVSIPLNDTLIILAARLYPYPPGFDVKSGSKFIDISYKYNGDIPDYVATVEYYDELPVYDQFSPIIQSTVYNWDIERLKCMLKREILSNEGKCTMIRVVTRKNRIVDWEEYRFDEQLWRECDSDNN